MDSQNRYRAHVYNVSEGLHLISQCTDSNDCDELYTILHDKVINTQNVVIVNDGRTSAILSVFVCGKEVTEDKSFT
jgi:hypothetical protein